MPDHDDMASGPPTTHSPAQEYTFRIPSPPRIAVPPALFSSDGIPTALLIRGPPVDYESSGFSNADFLSTVTHGNYSTTKTMLEWKYEQRRTAQKITPFMYLGPMSAAKDKDFLQREGITMTMAVRNTQSAQAKLLGSREAQELGLEIVMIDVAGNQELIAAFPQGIEAINTHLSKMYRLQQARATHVTAITGGHAHSAPGKVLVFCESGNERSATMVAAYMMAMYSRDLMTVLQFIQAQRFCVAYDDALRNLLRTYEEILKAKRDVHQAGRGEVTLRRLEGGDKAQANEPTQAGKSMKRTFDDTHDNDMDVDMDDGHEEMDAARFEKREGLAPFIG